MDNTNRIERFMQPLIKAKDTFRKQVLNNMRDILYDLMYSLESELKRHDKYANYILIFSEDDKCIDNPSYMGITTYPKHYLKSQIDILNLVIIFYVDKERFIDVLLHRFESLNPQEQLECANEIIDDLLSMINDASADKFPQRPIEYIGG